VRHLPRLSDGHGDEVSFVVPLLLADTKLKIQIFVKGDKMRHNLICKQSQCVMWPLTCCPLGAYLKREAARVGGTRFLASQVEVWMAGMRILNTLVLPRS
jgi:hypothetical protein